MLVRAGRSCAAGAPALPLAGGARVERVRVRHWHGDGVAHVLRVPLFAPMCAGRRARLCVRTVSGALGPGQRAGALVDGGSLGPRDAGRGDGGAGGAVVCGSVGGGRGSVVVDSDGECFG